MKRKIGVLPFWSFTFMKYVAGLRFDVSILFIGVWRFTVIELYKRNISKNNWNLQVSALPEHLR